MNKGEFGGTAFEESAENEAAFTGIIDIGTLSGDELYRVIKEVGGISFTSNAQEALAFGDDVLTRLMESRVDVTIEYGSGRHNEIQTIIRLRDDR